MEYGAARNRSLDGVRGFATLIVLLHHHSYLNSGWLGIDIFFVLSGYLITNILRRSRTDTFFWKAFWLKRVTRIVPPLLILLIAVRLIYHVPLLELAGYMFSWGDILVYARPFDPIGPLWSLAIEEHFYILWPFAVRLLPKRTLIYMLAGIVVAEPLLRALMGIISSDWRIYYYLTPFRLDGLCLGCLLAIFMESEDSRNLLAKWSSWWILAACAAWFTLRLSLGTRFTRENASFTYNSLAYSIVSLASFALLAYLVTHSDSILAKVFSWRWLTFTGSISYGLYLYQLIIREVVSRGLGLSLKRAFFIDLPLTFLVAWISYQVYERPITDWGRRKARALALSAKDSGARLAGVL